jgi:hypothetical protein
MWKFETDAIDSRKIYKHTTELIFVITELIFLIIFLI